MHCIPTDFVVNVSLKSRVRENRTHGSVGGGIRMKLLRQLVGKPMPKDVGFPAIVKKTKSCFARQ